MLRWASRSSATTREPIKMRIKIVVEDIIHRKDNHQLSIGLMSGTSQSRDRGTVVTGPRRLAAV